MITQYAQEEGHEVTNKDSEFWVDHIARGNQCDRDLMVLLRERDNAIVRAKKAESEISAEREKNRWISVKERLPKSNILVNVSYRLESGLRVRQSAIYIAPKTILAEDFLSDDIDCSDAEEYDEENDCYWVVEGWWEDSFESDMNYKISREITHWQPLPEPPEREEK